MSKLTLSQLVLAKRKELEWSQQKLAEMAKVSIDTVRKLENGKNTNPTLFVLQGIKKALGIIFEI